MPQVNLPLGIISFFNYFLGQNWLLKQLQKHCFLHLFCTLLFFSVPSAPIFAGTCEVNNKTTEICLSWLKHEGGNLIDNYLVEWMIDGNLNYSDTISYNGMESSTYTINNLQPAQAVSVSIQASNSAGESEALTKMYATGKSILKYYLFFYLFFGAKLVA